MSTALDRLSDEAKARRLRFGELTRAAEDARSRVLGVASAVCHAPPASVERIVAELKLHLFLLSCAEQALDAFHTETPHHAV